MPPSIPGRQSNRAAPFLLVLLAFCPAAAGAGSSEGTLSLSVRVVESCRVPAPNGLGSELAPCPTTRDRIGARAAPVPPGGGSPVAARTVVERSKDGTAYLTTIY